jgi:hypothetical protein
MLANGEAQRRSIGGKLMRGPSVILTQLKLCPVDHEARYHADDGRIAYFIQPKIGHGNDCAMEDK